MGKFCCVILLFLSGKVLATTAPLPPLHLTATPAAVYPLQPLLLSWTANSGHQAGVSDFGVYLLPASGGQRLLYGPLPWQTTKTNYQVSLKAEANPGLYRYRVYACNLSNYCSYADITVQVSSPQAPAAPVDLTLPDSLLLGQTATLSWRAGTGHTAGHSAFGVYVTAPGGRERLLQGPINWQASQTRYQLIVKPAEGTGVYQYRVYACNFSNYCRHADKSMLVASSSQTLFKVTATAGTGGVISPSLITVAPGSSAAFTVTPNAGFVVDKVEGCGIAPSGTLYQTAAINADCHVSAFFRPVPASLTLYLHTDITGSVIAESAADANIKKTSAYKPFGESIDN